MSITPEILTLCRRSNLDSRANRKGSANLRNECCSSERSDTCFVTQCGAVFVEELIDETFESADFSAGLAVLLNERDQPLQPIGAGHC